MTRPGDLVYCIAPIGDPRKQHDMIGLSPPVKGCVYTVETVIPGASGEDTYIFAEAGSHYVDTSGDLVLITWQAKCFRPARPQSVSGLLASCMGSMTNAQMQGYAADYRLLVAEANQHRRAKY